MSEEARSSTKLRAASQQSRKIKLAMSDCSTAEADVVDDRHKREDPYPAKSAIAAIAAIPQVTAEKKQVVA